jgi:hypothetical protein
MALATGERVPLGSLLMVVMCFVCRQVGLSFYGNGEIKYPVKGG